MIIQDLKQSQNLATAKHKTRLRNRWVTRQRLGRRAADTQSEIRSGTSQRRTGGQRGRRQAGTGERRQSEDTWQRLRNALTIPGWEITYLVLHILSGSRFRDLQAAGEQLKDVQLQLQRRKCCDFKRSTLKGDVKARRGHIVKDSLHL